MEQLLLLNPEDASDEDVEKYPVREAARAVVFDTDGNIAILHVSKKQYYKLPGGGLEDGEDAMSALARECREEIGCDIEVTGEVGSIVEYRKFCELQQISYCYLAAVKGEKGVPSFTETEIEDGFECLRVSYDEALRLISESVAANLEGRAYITPRDAAFLKEAKMLLRSA